MGTKIKKYESEKKRNCLLWFKVEHIRITVKREFPSVHIWNQHIIINFKIEFPFIFLLFFLARGGGKSRDNSVGRATGYGLDD
jgi:hypothetical protein